MQYIKPLNLIFVHIPKTGGTFIEKQLREINKELYNNNKALGGHSSINNFISKLKIKNISSYNRFAVVRNPYDRIISAYNYLKKNKSTHRGAWNNLGSPLSISDFICRIYNLYKKKKLSRIQVKNWHFQQQYKFVVNNLNKKNILCNILKYENLKEDFEKFIELYKIKKNIYNLLYNKIYKKIKIKEQYDILNILSSKHINMINEIYKEDFLLFGYDNIQI